MKTVSKPQQLGGAWVNISDCFGCECGDVRAADRLRGVIRRLAKHYDCSPDGPLPDRAWDDHGDELWRELARSELPAWQTHFMSLPFRAATRTVHALHAAQQLWLAAANYTERKAAMDAITVAYESTEAPKAGEAASIVQWREGFAFSHHTNVPFDITHEGGN